MLQRIKMSQSKQEYDVYGVKAVCCGWTEVAWVRTAEEGLRTGTRKASGPSYVLTVDRAVINDHYQWITWIMG